MADTRKIVIEIQNISKNEATQQVEPAQPQQQGNGTASDNSEAKTLGKSVILNQALHQAKSMIVNTVRRDANRYFSLGEDYLAETTYNNIETAISKGVGLATAIGGGAMVGGPIGAIIGAGAWGYSEAISYRDRMSGYYQNLNASRIQSGFESKRAGLTDGSRGTEN